MDLCDERLTLRGNKSLILYIDISCNERLINTEVMRDPGSIPNGGNIFTVFFSFSEAEVLFPLKVTFHWIFFPHSKASDANIGIFANFF